MFKHMKIGTRLLLAFGVVLAIMFGISGAGLWGAYSMSDNMLKMVSKDSKVISSSYAVQSDLLSLRRYEKDIFLNMGSSDKQAEYFTKWNNEHKDLVVSLDTLEKNIANVKDRASVQVMKQELAVYDAGFNKVYNSILLKDIKTPQEANKAIAEYKEATHKMEKSALDIAEAAGAQLKVEEKSITALSDSIIWVLVVLSVIAIIITIIAAVTTMRRITGPLQDGVGIADKIAEGNLTASDIEAGSNDELGFLAKSLNKMKNSLGDVIGQILGASDAVASASEELSATVQEIVKRVDDQASRAGQVATSSTEMSQTVIDIARNVQDISQAAQKTVKIAEDGSGVVTKTIREVQEIATTVTDASQIMGSLGEKSKQIGEIITVINDIADQTNLLALNAAIEAARAGEQGRGFAVVADEVRKLAERTTKATTEIAHMVTAIQDEAGRSVAAMNSSFERVQNGVALSKEAGTSLRLILDSISDLRASVDHIATAMDEMSTASDGITDNIEAIANVSRDTSDSSKEIQRASEELLNLSVSLNQIVGRFNIRSSERRINVKPKISVSALSSSGAQAI